MKLEVPASHFYDFKMLLSLIKYTVFSTIFTVSLWNRTFTCLFCYIPLFYKYSQVVRETSWHESCNLLLAKIDGRQMMPSNSGNKIYTEVFSINSTLPARNFIYNGVAAEMAVEISGYTMCRVRLFLPSA